MIKEICLAAVVALCLSTSPNTGGQVQINPVTHTVKNTPHRIGTEGTISCIMESYTFSEALKTSDLIAEVEITEWLDETDEPSRTTFFKAKILNVYKNLTNPDLKEIVLLQSGNSKQTVEDYPLFENGDRFILFLKKTQDLDIKDSFWILGGDSTILAVKEVDGVEYATKLATSLHEIEDIEIEEPSEIHNFMEKEVLLNENEISWEHQTFIKNDFESKLKGSIEKAGDSQ